MYNTLQQPGTACNTVIIQTGQRVQKDYDLYKWKYKIIHLFYLLKHSIFEYILV